ncbi:hypothetical protein AA0228_3029 [Gluconobacter frateurii NRIC 0228]|uniref:Rap1a immunity protein domain-containing protein n=2 Tax=Gluconobacter frateurii TaxID=38308 RepID=A0ABQ0QFP1_9PROT|nr:hypothetical protein AA0228_3029 [Gluconobacter frateurii NRIC 0228]
MLPLLFGGFAHAQSSQFDVVEPCQDIVIRLDSDDERHIQKVAIYNLFSGYKLGASAASSGKNGDTSYLGIGDGIKFDFVFSYVKNYCLNNPSDDLLGAMLHLMADLRKKK